MIIDTEINLCWSMCHVEDHVLSRGSMIPLLMRITLHACVDMQQVMHTLPVQASQWSCRLRQSPPCCLRVRV